MDGKELQSLLTAALGPLVEKVGAMEASIADLKAKQEKAAVTPAPVTPAPVTPPSDGNKISLKDLMASLGTTVADAIKEQMKPLEGFVASATASTKGTKHSLSANEIQFFGKYTEKKVNDEMQAEDYQAIIDSVKYDDKLPRDRKIAMLEAASSIKRDLLRKRFVSGGGQ